MDRSSIGDLGELKERTRGDARVTIAVLDGPVDLAHPCFAGADLTQLATSVGGQGGSLQASSHGTHVASMIFGQPSEDGTGIGIAPRCRGLIVPVFAETEQGELLPCSQLDLARAITQSVAHGANVISISGGQLEPSGEAERFLADAVKMCADNNLLIVAAAGNNGCECLHVPAAIPTVLAVGAMNMDGEPLDFSNWGSNYTENGVLATGVNVLGATPGGGYEQRTGTSFATPIVTGVVGLLMSLQLEQGSEIDAHQVRQAILASTITCDQLPVTDCRRLLAGRLNPSGAITHLTKGNAPMMNQPNPVAELGQPENDPRNATNTGNASASVANTCESRPSEAVSSSMLVGASEIGGASKAVREGSMAATETQQCESAGSTESRTNRGASSSPSACGCGTGATPQPVFVFGQLWYDFGNEANRDAYLQMRGFKIPETIAELQEFKASSLHLAEGVIWTLRLDATPIYALRPAGPFALKAYEQILSSLVEQLEGNADQVAIAGRIVGQTRLLNGQIIPVIEPDIRGLWNWNIDELACSAVDACANVGADQDGDRREFNRDAFKDEVKKIAVRIYYDYQNFGLTAQERALNFAATNLFQVTTIVCDTYFDYRQLDQIAVERSPICRPGSDCWDVKMVFFNPRRRIEESRKVYRFTVDVSGIIPVTVGPIRAWEIY